MKVLLIGFGKIGQIKAGLWQSMGLEVFIYDANAEAKKWIIKSGYGIATSSILEKLALESKLIVDISTPASKHVLALEWALNILKSNYPEWILLEKPVVSSKNELDALKLVLSHHTDFDENNIIVNESYFSSAALGRVKSMIEESGEKLTQFSIELSKNRISDNDNGRFFDYSLGTLGVEMPHMVAILQLFGLSLKTLAKNSPALYIDQDRFDNQGFTIRYKDNDLDVELKSFLGNFRILSNSNYQKNTGVIRVLELATKSKRYEITFDPAPDTPRYHAKIIITDSSTKNASEVIIEDNHLREHLLQLSGNRKRSTWNLSSLENGLNITNVLFELQAKALITKVDLSEERAKVLA